MARRMAILNGAVGWFRLGLQIMKSATALWRKGSRPLSREELRAMRGAIRHYVRQIAQRFRPDKIILFGSFAFGTPNEDSDVDLLVVMPVRNPVSQTVRIRMALESQP